MPLILEPERYTVPALEALIASLTADLEDTLDLVAHPRGQVLDPASLETAEALLRSARALVAAEGPRETGPLAAKANLAYAALLAAIDLVKSHTDVPRVPARRSPSSPV